MRKLIALLAPLLLVLLGTGARADTGFDNWRPSFPSLSGGTPSIKSQSAQASPKRQQQQKASTGGSSRGSAPSRPSGSYSSGGGGSSGIASYYWQPQRVASGGWFNPNAMTAAHKTLPFGTRVRVTHMGNGRSVDVTINDRGPYIAGRIIDLSKAAAGVIGMQSQGIANVRMTVLGR